MQNYRPTWKNVKAKKNTTCVLYRLTQSPSPKSIVGLYLSLQAQCLQRPLCEPIMNPIINEVAETVISIPNGYYLQRTICFSFICTSFWLNKTGRRFCPLEKLQDGTDQWSSVIYQSASVNLFTYDFLNQSANGLRYSFPNKDAGCSR